MSLSAAVKNEVKGLSPAYFTLVMATGIVSIGANMLGFPTVSDVLFWVNNGIYAVLVLLLLFRLLFYFKQVVSDFYSFMKGAGFFSFVAGTCVLGIQHAQLKQYYEPASVLLWVGVGVWVLLIYGFFLVITTESDKPSLEKGISGVWLLMVVATQAMAILGTSLSKQLPFTTEQVLFFTISAFLLGIMLYIILITLIFYRLTFFPTKPKEVTAPYWINEGAVAITTLAGATILQNISNSNTFTEFLPFIKGICMLAWITATWWIPIIFFLEVWKYLFKKVSLTYTPKLWSLVFCLGGYTVATSKLAKVIGAPYIQGIPEVFFYISSVLWCLVLLGMLISMGKGLSASTNENTSG